MHTRLVFLLSILAAGSFSCNQKAKQQIFPQGSFGYDLNFLEGHDSNLVVLKNGQEQVIVSPKYQGKVFTSAAAGENGQSFGWIHYKSFEGPASPHINVYGGESRFWLGPEGGKYSLYFKPGAKMEFPNWQTPAGIDTEAWNLILKTDHSVSMEKDMQLVNYAGASLSLSVGRKVQLLDRHGIDSLFQLTGEVSLANDTSLKAVGYVTLNTLSNKSNFAWTEKTGTPSIWILDMFPPSPATTIVIPFHKNPLDSAEKPATTDYFGEIPKDRIHFDNNTIYFRADGKSRGKLGIHPASASKVMGSYDTLNKVLTILSFDVDGQAKYLNQEWNTVKPPFSGDAANAYNDGPLSDGSQLGPFYEMESVSPAAFLAPGQSLTHSHAVMHLTGPESSLDRIARQILGVSLDDIKRQFQ